jgi:hypothetical protein
MQTEEDFRKTLEAAVAAVRKEEGKGPILSDAEAKDRLHWHVEFNPNAANQAPEDLIRFWRWAETQNYGLDLLKKLRYRDAVEEHLRRK